MSSKTEQKHRGCTLDAQAQAVSGMDACGSRLCLWFGFICCWALLPLLSVAADTNGATLSETSTGTNLAVRSLVLPPKMAGVLSNWPSVGIQTGFLIRANQQTKQKADYKWSSGQQETQGRSTELRVPDEFALPPPEAPRGMVAIPGGMFVMGFGSMTLGKEAVDARKITRYSIDAYEVPGCVWTEVRQWAITHGYTNLAVGQNGAKLGGGEAETDHPVVNVTWYDCVKWCNARSEKEMLVPAYYLNETQKKVYRTGVQDLSSVCVDWTANGYRLPTEAEWEKASRGGVSGQLYPFGDKLESALVNYSGGVGGRANGTTPIGHFRNIIVKVDGKNMVISDENGYGLHDMSGNVYEWCWDWFGPYTTNACGPVTGAYRVMRGGCWASVEDINLTCAHRNAMRPGSASPYVGFRCVRKH